jgi:inosose dehydratase
MTMRIGINPLTWTNDDLPELGGDTPLETCLIEARQAGYAGMELGHKFPRTPERLAPLMKSHGLEVVSGWYSSNLLDRTVEAEIDALEPHLHLLASVGSRVLVLCETTRAVHGVQAAPLSTRPRLTEPQWKRLTESLTRLGEHTAKRGIKLAYHHHMGTVIQTSEEIDRLMYACGPEVWLLLDSGHATYAGSDPVTLARTHGPRLAHVHTKDVRRRVLDWALEHDVPFLAAVLEGVFTVPGDGCVDYPAFFAALAEANYSGWAVVEAEQDPKKAHPLTYAKMGYENAHARAREAGLL